MKSSKEIKKDEVNTYLKAISNNSGAKDFTNFANINTTSVKVPTDVNLTDEVMQSLSFLLYLVILI
mgnify:CR=1 FL=1